MRPRGTLSAAGGYATLTFHRTYRHSAANVWSAIATPDGLRGWLMCTQVAIDARVGGRIEMVSGPAAYHSTGNILEWDPPRVLEYEWNVAPVPEMPSGEHAIFRYELTPDGESTHLLVTYRRITMQTAPGFLPGLHAFLDRLEAQLDERDLPDWLQQFGEVRSEYPEWSGHAPDSGK
jgi:uncharacterized protein YndB with AHSA1/START domain